MDEDTNEDVYCIWRFLIDKKFQGKGYGKANRICLSYEPKNTAAKAQYESLGFRETDEIEDDQIVSVLRI
ncbi:MAG: GNAT family N-acetyltransferase [Candidatus Delongbacteria bacterium]|nr:GNAT family N-acetyltransferase [Candidatus Delongbacteria bacterium]MBN2834107.1 GNAT family N-acetyltransferase [Candidatus Delongbacteria bacterium]